jgi:hypothetical protein
MSDKNWDAELAKIDKQLASISDEQLLAEKRAATVKGGPAGAATVTKPAALPASTAPASVTKPVGTWRGWLQAAIALAAAVGLVFWPWPPNCGLPLYGLIAASGATSLLGVWSAIGTWRHRLGAAHIVSLAVVAWGLLFGAREVLPRVGYALPDGVRGASWECSAPAVPVVPPANTTSTPPP